MTPTKAQIAGRIERVELSGMTPSFIPDIFDVGADPASFGVASQRDLSFTPKSASIGLIQNLPGKLVASVTAQYVERAPKPAELFSRGPHEATATFDIGDPNLRDRESQVDRGWAAAGDRAVPFRGYRLSHALRRLHFPQSLRRDLRRNAVAARPARRN